MSVCFRHASSANRVGTNVILRFWRIQKGNFLKKQNVFQNKKIIFKECRMSYTLLSFP